MESLVRLHKKLNEIRLKTLLKKMVIETRIYERIVPFTAWFDFMTYRHEKDHHLSEIGLIVHIFPTVNLHVTMIVSDENWMDQFNNVQQETFIRGHNIYKGPNPRSPIVSKAPHRLDFEASEFERIIKVLEDPHILVFRQKIYRCRTGQ